MRFSAQQYAQALYDMTGTVPVSSFLKLLENHKQIRMLERIAREYEKLLLQNNALPEIIVRAQEALSAELKKAVLAKFGLPEGTAVREIIDPSMIGGLSIKHNNMLFDFSLQTRLTKLQQQLTR